MLGGKLAGVFLAEQILRKSLADHPEIGEVRLPRAFYVASDAVRGFVRHNNLEEVYEQKYKEIDQVRHEYPHLVQVFKNSQFPPEIVKGLSLVLDELHDTPIIVRCSSLLEDRVGAAFSGKYKSLFLANQGTKRERLNALMDAIAEVYASIFGPDPIQYRAERGLLDFHEEMGIMIQEVVGTRWAATSSPPSPASPSAQRVPLVAAGQAGGRADPHGAGARDPRRGSRSGGLPDPGGARPAGAAGERHARRGGALLPAADRRGGPRVPQPRDAAHQDAACGVRPRIPGDPPHRLVQARPQIVKPVGAYLDLEQGEPVVTFEGLISDTPFVREDRAAMLRVLEERSAGRWTWSSPPTGREFYLLQCRPQSFARENVPAAIPRDLPEKSILFSATRFVSNGHVPDITHVVYVDPDRYNELAERRGPARGRAAPSAGSTRCCPSASSS